MHESCDLNKIINEIGCRNRCYWSVLPLKTFTAVLPLNWRTIIYSTKHDIHAYLIHGVKTPCQPFTYLFGVSPDSV